MCNDLQTYTISPCYAKQQNKCQQVSPQETKLWKENYLSIRVDRDSVASFYMCKIANKAGSIFCQKFSFYNVGFLTLGCSRINNKKSYISTVRYIYNAF